MRFLEKSSGYHVVSRAAFRRFLFDDEGKRKFVDLMRRQAAFCGAEISAFCVMSNHFHLLVSFLNDPIPQTDRELLRRYRRLYPQGEWLSEKTLSPDRLGLILKEGGQEAEHVKAKLHARMGDLSVFVKELKQRFSIWFNRHRDNVGTLWESNFKSQIVQNDSGVVRKVAAYIEMNPVRAGIVERPEDYEWSSLGLLKMRSSSIRDSVFRLWFGDAGLSEATLAECNMHSERDRRLLRAGCIGTPEFVGKICQKFLPKRSAGSKPVSYYESSSDVVTLRKVSP